MKIELKVNLKELIETVVDTTVDHYVDDYEDGMRYSHRRIEDECIETMKSDLVRKLVAIFNKDRSE